MPLNVSGCHWVALVIDIVKCQILVLDSDVAVTTSEEMGRHVRPFCVMNQLYLERKISSNISSNILLEHELGNAQEICAQKPSEGNFNFEK